jgi:trigger factor
VRGQVLDALYRDNPIDLPRALVDEQVQQLQVEAARRLGVREASQIPPREPFEEPARRRVALGLLLSQLVQTQGLSVERERVRARLERMVADYPNPDEARRAYQQSPDAMRQIESATLEDQAVDWLLAHAQVTDRPMTFADLTGFGRAEAAHAHDHDHAGHDHSAHGHGHAPHEHGHSAHDHEHPAHEHEHRHDPTSKASDT